MKQYCNDLINLLTDIKLNEKEGIQSPSVKINDYEILIVPMWVTDACCPLGNLTVFEITEVMDVKKEM